ncbi:MAG: hypothetical protein ABI147_08480 [Acidobacteriaceae bacterium]
MQRPQGITVTTLLMAFNILMGIVVMLIGSSWSLANIHPAGHATVSGTILALRLMAAVALIVECVAVLFYWLGKFWARRLVLVGCAFYLFPIIHLRVSWRQSHFGAAITVYGAILALFLLWYLFTREAKAWFPWPAAAARYR